MLLHSIFYIMVGSSVVPRGRRTRATDIASLAASPTVLALPLDYGPRRPADGQASAKATGRRY
jgi:hypothetical protein